TMYDTTPAEEAGWVVDPFAAARIPWKGLGECIVARGAQDTKGPLALIHNVIAHYRDAGVPLPVNVILVQEASELASGSMAGFVAAHQETLRQADVVWWPMFSQRPDGTPVVHLGAKGNMMGKFRCRGGDWGGPVEADLHGLHANWVASPVMRLVQALASMKTPDDRDVAIEGFYGKASPPSEADIQLLRELAARIDVEELKRYLGIKRFKQDDIFDALYDYCFKSEFNISGIRAGAVIEGGHKVVLPTEAVAAVDIRPVGQTVQDIVSAIERHLAKHFPEVTFELISGYEGDRMPIDNWAVQELLATYREMGMDPEIWPNQATAIAVALWTRLGLAWITSAPAIAGGLHAANEYLQLESYRRCHEFAVRLLWRLGTGRFTRSARG
ncbi:MAG TPA: M20/M25/M40 family metallo-hydrolase, partial [Bacillota bacterium]